VTRDWNYWPACEGLLYQWWKQGGQCWRPAYWHRVGIPGSGRQWLRADVEYVLAFKSDASKLAFADPTANGKRVHEKPFWNADGSKTTQAYTPPALANPGNLIQGITVGGGHLGHPLAHENEAPFPLKLAEWFIRGWCPPGGTVCDPFSGSGTTAHAAFNLGRNAHCFDIRLSQVFLGRKRLREVENVGRIDNGGRSGIAGCVSTEGNRIPGDAA
jgi:hypothetical protein